MLARQLFEEGKVRDAQALLTQGLRTHPDDESARTFLFELLCFSGDWDRAQRQATALLNGNSERDMGVASYLSALHAERIRHATARADTLANNSSLKPVSGTCNGHSFQRISDLDPTIGEAFEVFTAGSYMRLSFGELQSVQMEPPRKLRDLLWMPATLRTKDSFRGGESKQVLIPVIYPFTFEIPDEALWLGRETRWIEEGRQGRPAGQKMLLIDEEEVPLLEIRELRFDSQAGVDYA